MLVAVMQLPQLWESGKSGDVPDYQCGGANLGTVAKPVADVAPFLSNLLQSVHKYYLKCFVDCPRVIISGLDV